MDHALKIIPFLFFSVGLWASESLLILGPSGPGFDEVRDSMANELREDFHIHNLVMDQQLDLNQLRRNLARYKPNLVVLMNNSAIELYKECQQTLKIDELPLAIGCMALFIEDAMRNMPKAVAVSYDIPAVTSLVNLRDLIDLPVERVGVLYRPGFQSFIDRQQRYCAREEIQLIPYSIGSDHLGKNIKRGLAILIKQEKIDALWVPNDNMILTPKLIKKSWLPGLKAFRKPVVVGVPGLLHNRFGNFSVLPDHGGLGKQIAGLAIEIMGNHWQIGDNLLREPLTVSKHLKVGYARKYLHLREEKTMEVDFLLN